MEHKLGWEKFKTFLLESEADFKVLELEKDYIIKAKDDWFSVVCYLQKSDPSNADQTEFESLYKGNAAKRLGGLKLSPFAEKKFLDKDMFLRIHGIKHDLNSGTTIDFVIPHNQVKFNIVEIIGGTEGDTVEFKILDTPLGTINGVPSAELNQYGYAVNVAEGHYVKENPYDADMIKDMVVRIEYQTSNPKTIGINYTMHEIV